MTKRERERSARENAPASDESTHPAVDGIVDFEGDAVAGEAAVLDVVDPALCTGLEPWTGKHDRSRKYHHLSLTYPKLIPALSDVAA